MSEIEEIPTEKLELDPENVRPDPQLDPEFVESVGEGVMQNLIVRPKPDSDKYLVTVGERRFLAGKNAGRETFPCKIREDLENEDTEAMGLSMKENEERRDIPEWVKPDKARECADRLGVSLSEESGQKKVARTMGWNISLVRRFAKILDLPDWTEEMMKGPDERDLDDWQEALLKGPSERSNSEKEALEEEGISEGVDSIVERSETIDSSDTAEEKVLSSKVAADLARSDIFEEIRGDKVESFRTVLEATEEGQSGLDDLLDALETRIAEAEVKQREESVDQKLGSGELQKVTVELDRMQVDALERVMEDEGLDELRYAVILAIRGYLLQGDYFEQ